MKFTTFFLIVSFWLLVGCSSGSTRPQVSLEEGLAQMGYAGRSPVDRISQYQLRDWKYVNDHAVVLETGSRSHHLVTFSISCPELRTAMAIAIKSGMNSVTKHDDIIVRTSPGLRRCPISEIFLLKEASEAPESEE
jgi:hypothetical protein